MRFDWETQRWPGVLQRIGICYGIAGLIVLSTGVRLQAVLFAAILAGYWAILTFVAPPGGVAGDLSKKGNLAGWIDRSFLPGKIYQAYYGDGDNEGILSTLPAVATTLLGVLAGHWLRSGFGAAIKTLGLALAGSACLAGGYYWAATFPIIKNLWTSSFVLFAGGWSLLLLALFYGVIDGLKWRTWSFFFVVIGANAILIYIAPTFIDFEKAADVLFGGVAKYSGSFKPVLEAAAVLAVKWVLLLWLYRNKLFLRV
jgi:predicted acyltransferase